MEASPVDDGSGSANGTSPPSARSIATDRATLSLTPVRREEIVLGAFQRRASALVAGDLGLVTRRASGGPALVVGPGTLHLILSLPSPDAVVADADAARIVNRHVRPLLRALTRVGAHAAYFGRDVVTVAKRPATWVGFAHHAETGATLFEAFVAVTHPFALPAELDGAPLRRELPYGGKNPTTLAAATDLSLDPEVVTEAIVATYLAAYPSLTRVDLAPSRTRPACADRRAPFAATLEIPLGFLGAIATNDDTTIGGDLLASEDLIEAASAALACDPEALAALLRAHPGVLEGARPADLIALADQLHKRPP